MKVIDTLWFTNINGTSGIVVIEEDVTGDRKAYMGVVGGKDEKADIEALLAWGTKISLDVTLRLRHLLTEKAEKKCDFNCGKNDEPLIAFGNTDTGDKWLCHLSCLRTHLEMQEELLEERR